MKTLILAAALAVILTSPGCTLKQVIGPDGDIKITNISGSTDGNTATGTTNSDSYQPVTKGSTWTYNIYQYGLTFKFIYTMTGNTSTLNGFTLNEFNFDFNPNPTEQGYYANSNHLYIIRQKHDINNNDVMVSVPYLKDDAAVGDTWQGDSFASGTQDYNGMYTCSMLEKNITKVVNNKTFGNVYHTHVELKLTYSGTGTGSTQLVESHDYFIAKGVGIIELDDYENGSIASKEAIFNYTIK